MFVTAAVEAQSLPELQEITESQCWFMFGFIISSVWRLGYVECKKVWLSLSAFMLIGQSGLGKSTLMNTLFKSKVSRKSVLATSQEKIPKTVEIKSISHGMAQAAWLLAPFSCAFLMQLIYFPLQCSFFLDVHSVFKTLCYAGTYWPCVFADIEEKGVRMKLTVIDTPGFGDQINNENWYNLLSVQQHHPNLTHTSTLSHSVLAIVSWQPIMKFINDQYEAYLQEEININRKKRIPDSRVHCCIYFIPPTGHW